MNKNQKPQTFTLVEKFWKKKFGDFPSNVQLVSEAYDNEQGFIWKEFLVKTPEGFRRLTLKESRRGAATRYYLEEN